MDVGDPLGRGFQLAAESIQSGRELGEAELGEKKALLMAHVSPESLKRCLVVKVFPSF